MQSDVHPSDALTQFRRELADLPVSDQEARLRPDRPLQLKPAERMRGTRRKKGALPVRRGGSSKETERIAGAVGDVLDIADQITTEASILEDGAAPAHIASAVGQIVSSAGALTSLVSNIGDSGGLIAGQLATVAARIERLASKLGDEPSAADIVGCVAALTKATDQITSSLSGLGDESEGSDSTKQAKAPTHPLKRKG